MFKINPKSIPNRQILGNFFWEPVIGNLFFGNLAWKPVLGSLFLGTCSSFLGTLLGNLFLEPNLFLGTLVMLIWAVPTCAKPFTMASDLRPPAS